MLLELQHLMQEKMDVFAVFCIFLQGLEPLIICEVVAPERQWIHPFSSF